MSVTLRSTAIASTRRSEKMKKDMRITLLATTLITLLVAAAAYPVTVFLFQTTKTNRETSAKISEFINLPEVDYTTLIQKSKDLAQAELNEQDYIVSYGEGFERPIPIGFESYGFLRIRLEKKKLVGLIYSSFDSGGDLVVDWNDPNNENIKIIEGDDSDIITPLFTK